MTQKNDLLYKNNESQYYSTKILTPNYSINENNFCNIVQSQQQYFSQNMITMQNQNLIQMKTCQMNNQLEQMKNANLNASININMINNMLILPEYKQNNYNNYSNINEENYLRNDNINNFLYKQLVNNHIKNYYQNQKNPKKSQKISLKENGTKK